MDEWVSFGSAHYFLLVGLLGIARGADFLSTWIATPNLLLEANPIAKKLGWKGGALINVVLCLLFGLWPLPAIIIMTASALVAARNFQSAWLMRSLGEQQYRYWIAQRLLETHPGLYLFCLLAQTLLLTAVGAALVFFSDWSLVPFAVGIGIFSYAIIIVTYTLLSLRRMRRSP